MAKKKHRPPATKQLRIPGPKEYNEPPEELNQYLTLLMGAKGAGKTTASASWEGNLNFMWEPRRRNVRLRMVGADDGIIFRSAQEILDGAEDPWHLFVEYNAAAVEDDTVQTITWDTVDIAYEACFESTCASFGVTHPNQISDDFGNSWNIIKSNFRALIDTIASSDTSLLFISHVKEREQEFQEGSGKLSLVGPSCSPACLQILKASCDFWMYYGKEEGRRTVWVRDQTNVLDVSCGCGFLDEDGNELEKVNVSGPREEIYDKLNRAFKGESTKPRPRTTKKKVARKKRR